MNQSTAISLSPESSTSGLTNHKVISLSKVRMYQRAVIRHRINMRKQRLSGIVLLAIGWAVRIMTSDCLVFLILGFIAFDMILNPKYIMQFNEQKGEKHNG